MFEGRAGGPTLPVVGAATQGFNTGSVSVSVMGNFDAVAPPAAAISALENLLAWRLDVAHLAPRGRAVMVSGGGSNTRYSAGMVVTLPVIAGHRQTGYTDCPGTVLFGMLPQIRNAIAAIGLPKIYRPTLLPPSVVAGSGQSIEIKAWATEPLTWTIAVIDGDGATIASFPPQSGQALDLVWAGDPPFPIAPGVYQVAVAGQTPDGRVATSASVPLTVTPVPTPTPTPSPTPTPTPSPTPSSSNVATG